MCLILFKQIEGIKSRRASPCKVNALPDWPLMAVLVQHMEFQRDLVTHKSIWHLSDESIKSICKCFTSLIYLNTGFKKYSKIYSFTIFLHFPIVDAFYIMLTCWGCCFFGSVKVSNFFSFFPSWNTSISEFNYAVFSFCKSRLALMFSIPKTILVILNCQRNDAFKLGQIFIF